MDVRTKIVDQVLENLPELSPELRDKVERVLLVSLQDYEVHMCQSIFPERLGTEWNLESRKNGDFYRLETA